MFEFMAMHPWECHNISIKFAGAGVDDITTEPLRIGEPELIPRITDYGAY